MDRLIQFLSFEFEYGAPPSKVSMHYTEIETFADFGRDSLFVTDARGYQGIATRIAQPFRDRIRLKHTVRRIQIENAGHRRQRIKLFVDDGESQKRKGHRRLKVFRCRFLLVTASMGALQSGAVQFYPRLPRRKRQSIDAFEMIAYTPIYIKWPSDFWTSVIGDKKYIALAAAHSVGLYMYVLNLHHSHFYGGSLLWRVDVTANREAVKAQYRDRNSTAQRIVTELRRYFANVPDINGEDIFVAQWTRNKLVRGAYTNYAPGFEAEDVDRIKQRWHRNVHFVGAALSTKYDGFVHGAFQEGRHAALRLLKDRLNNEREHKNVE